MPNSAAPAFVQINYHSAYGPHSARIPTLDWNPGGDASGSFVTHNAGSVDASDMVNDYVDVAAPFFPDTVQFDNFIIYRITDISVNPIPVYSEAFVSKEGTGDGTSWSKAVQRTLIMRTDEFGIAKYVFLDAESGNNFDRITSAGADIAAFIAVISDGDNAFAGLDNGKPTTYLGVTTTLNEKLRRAYRMA